MCVYNISEGSASAAGPCGGSEAWRLGGSEAWRLGGLVARRPGGFGAWGLGGSEACRLGASMDILGALGCSLGVPWEHLGDPWELSRAHWSFWVLLGCSLGALLGSFWVLGCFLGFLWALLGWMRGGLSRLASISSALLGVLGGEMLQNVAVAMEWLVFLEKCCCGQRSGGVPLQFVSHRPLGSQFAYKTNAF